MLVNLTRTERDRLLRMVDAELRDLGPEIHHTRTYKDDLKALRGELRTLRDHLAAASPDERDSPSPELASAQPGGQF